MNAKSHAMAGRWFGQSPEHAIRTVCRNQLATYLPQEAIAEVYRAFVFAEQAHRNQKRQSGEQYIHHPIEVVVALSELKLDARTLMAGLLHDVIEDSLATKQQLQTEFGEDVALLVDGVSKIGKIRFNSHEEAEAENFRKMLMAMSQDLRVMIIKLADRLHNMRTLDAMRADKRRRISKQTLEIYAPIAERLGLHQWSRELQNLCMQHIYPNRYRTLKKAIDLRNGNRKQVVKKLRHSLISNLKDSGIEWSDIAGRRKSVYSVYKKMRKKRHSFTQLYDIYGFRIVVHTVDECYRVLGVIHNAYKPIPGRFADYIAIPKTNGYQSLHTVVFGPYGENIEVQIRTQDMHEIAEAGVAAHWVYKTDGKIDDSSSNLARQWLLDLLDPEHHAGSPVEFLEHLKADLYPDQVYVFTPTGDIKKMPRGATALDFAYAVHSDVGTHCTGAYINKELVSMPTQLKNGDKIEIITSKHSWPTATWLNYAITAKARTRIRNYLKRLTKEDAIKLGKRLLAGATKQRLLARRKIPQVVQDKLLHETGLQNWSDLLAEIGFGERLPSVVARQIALLSDNTKPDLDTQEELVIHGAEGLLVTYSKCCYPIAGDAILGSLTAGHGLVIHRCDCSNIAHKQPEKKLMVKWGENLQQEFSAGVIIQLYDEPGAIAQVVTAIAANDSNITAIESQQTSDNTTLAELVLKVKDRTHLAHIIATIRNQPKVVRVRRRKA